MNHIFGPVNSRRLGCSLGIDLFSEKVCNLNCVYCEIGVTARLTCERAEYVPTEEIIAEIDAYCRDGERLDGVDFVTVTASGEPTLHSGFGAILAHLKEVTGKPIAVLTNGTTLTDPEVRRELALADVVIPSLDAALPRSFRRIDRPAACLDLQKIIDGLVAFSKEYSGKLWLEILFVQGLNDTDEDVAALLDVIHQMRVDRIQLNTVARPPLEPFAKLVTADRLQEIAVMFRAYNDAVPVDLLATGAPVNKKKNVEQAKTKQHADQESALLEDILQMLKRRPCTVDDIDRSFQQGGPDKVKQLLEPLVQSGRVHIRSHGDKLYYQ
ncbi:MAG: radical SAM protein [Desulfobulbaceae bacterium]|nr:radical SAM protein [Desulfobulbaceae bacterium]